MLDIEETIAKGKAFTTKIDRVFLALCIAFLAMPLCLFNWRGEVSSMEKRILKAPPSLIVEGHFNTELFSDCSEYINDRFGLRSLLVQLDHIVFDRSIISQSRTVLYGKDNWLFYISRKAGTLADYCKINYYSDEEIRTIKEHLSSQYQWCKAHGIAFLVVIVPNKHNIYGEYYPIERPSGDTRLERLMASLGASGLPLIDLTGVLREHRLSEPILLYRKTDTHWNSLGAYIGFGPIRQAVRKLLPKVHFPDIEYSFAYREVAGQGDLVKQIGLTSYHTESEAIIAPKGEAWEDYYSIQEGYDSNPNDCIIHNKKDTSLPKALVYRDSFYGELLPYMATQFSTMECKWQILTKDEKVYILNAKPDIVIYEWGERNGEQILKEDGF